MQFLFEEPVFDEMFDADYVDPKVSLVSFGLLWASIFWSFSSSYTILSWHDFAFELIWCRGLASILIGIWKRILLHTKHTCTPQAAILPIKRIKEGDWVLVKFDKCFLARLYALRVMKSKFDVSVTIWYTLTLRIWTWRRCHILQKGFQCKWAPKNDQEGEKMALDILKITIQYCCALK